jgi:hypothetical protein
MNTIRRTNATQGQDLLYSDDEESNPTNHNNEATILLSTLGNVSQNDYIISERTKQQQQRSDYGSLNSDTSSLGNSDYDGRESYFRNNNAPVMNRHIDKNGAVNDIGLPLTGEDNRTLSSFLLAIFITCVFSMAILSGSSSGIISGQNNQEENNSNQNMYYFPFPDGSVFSPRGGLNSSLETSKYVPFTTLDRKDTGISASQIVFPELFHSSLRLSKNATTKIDYNSKENKERDDQSSSSPPLPLLKVPFPTVSI